MRFLALLTTLAMFFCGYVNAADIMPVSAMDVSSVGKVSSADTLKPGMMSTAIKYDSSTAPLLKSDINTNDIDNEVESQRTDVVKAVQKYSVLFGLGVMKRLEVNLGIHATSEQTSIENKQRLFAFDDESNRDYAPQTGFSGASLMAKFKLLNSGAAKMAFAPFVESGSGIKAVNSVSRSESTKGGWLTMLSYGERGVGELSLNFGYRYRQREQIAEQYLRNEMLYQAAATAYFSRRLAGFLAIHGRELRVADENERKEDNSLDYNLKHALQGQAGFMWSLRRMELSGYYGTKFKEDGIGQGKQIIGAGIAYLLGNVKSNVHSESREISEDDKKRDEVDVAAESQPKSENQNKQPEYESYYVDIDGNPVDPVKEVGDDQELKEKDDFQFFDEQSKQRPQNIKADEHEKMEQELIQLRKTEEKVMHEQERKQKAEDQLRRRDLRDITKQNSQKERQLKEQVKDEVDELPAVTKEDVEWNGLE